MSKNRKVVHTYPLRYLKLCNFDLLAQIKKTLVQGLLHMETFKDMDCFQIGFEEVTQFESEGIGMIRASLYDMTKNQPQKDYEAKLRKEVEVQAKKIKELESERDRLRGLLKCSLPLLEERRRLTCYSCHSEGPSCIAKTCELKEKIDEIREAGK